MSELQMYSSWILILGFQILFLVFKFILTLLHRLPASDLNPIKTSVKGTV